MKKPLSLLLSILFCVALCQGASDKIIFRDGHMEDVVIEQISDAQLRYCPKGSKADHRSVPTKDVYMFYTETYGNTYVTPEGKRFSGEPKGAEKNVDVIYLVSGKEIAAASITRFPDGICYEEKLPGKKRKGPAVMINLNNSDVFLIAYRNGMTEIVTELASLTPLPDPGAAKETVEEVVEEAPKYSVVFHEVKKWDSLSKLAEKYGVSADDIREWNDIPATVKDKAQLKLGTNLMIYVPNDSQ